MKMLPAAQLFAEVLKRLLGQRLGKDVSNLLGRVNFLDQETAIGHVIPEMMVADRDVLRAWPVLSLLGGDLKSTNIVFEHN